MPQNDDSTNLQSKQVLENRYEILEKIGTGGISTVYLARDIILKRTLALKMIKPEKLKDEHLVRLHREAKAICQLKHSNIIDVFDFIITGDNIPVLAMEYVEGKELSQIIAQSGPLPLEQAIPIFQQIGKAMAYAHSRKILHRDLKPGNVLIEEDTAGSTRVKIFDFGIAKVSDLDDDSITRSGFVAGTPTYMSPEQAKNESVDHRSDIYSMGCLMYFTLTGKPPLQGKNIVETINLQINQTAPALKDATNEIAFPESIESVLAKCLSKSMSARYQSMEELVTALNEVIANPAKDSEELEEQFEINESKKPKHTKLKKYSEAAAALILLVVLISFPLYFLVSSKQENKTPVEPKKDETELLLDAKISKSKKNGFDWYIIEGTLTDSQLTNLESIKPQRLSLRNTKFETAQLKRIRNYPLVILDVRNTDLTDEGMAEIAKTKGLQGLLAEGCKNLGHKGIRSLKALKSLKILSLRDTIVSDADVKELESVEDMRMLYVSKSPNITDGVLDSIMKFKNLNSVRLGGTKLTKAGIERIQTHPELTFVGLSDLNMDDNKMPKAFKQDLTMLDVSNNPFTDHSLKKILYMPDLWFLDIRNCKKISNRAVHLLSMKLHFSKHKICISERSGAAASFAMEADSEWYYEPDLYINPQWNNVEFRRNAMSGEHLLDGKQFPTVQED